MDTAKIAFCPITGCHLWVGAIQYKGYGVIRRNGRVQMAHRIAYEEVYGLIPEGKVIDHICRVHCCVNPDHLRAVTSRENTHAPKSESGPAKNAAKKYCPKCGGPFSVYRRQRYCKPCARAYRLEYGMKSRALINARQNAKRRDGGVS